MRKIPKVEVHLILSLDDAQALFDILLRTIELDIDVEDKELVKRLARALAPKTTV